MILFIKLIKHPFNFALIAFIILWGNYYNSSWEGQESFYNYIWGMNDYDLIQNSLYDFEGHLNLSVEIILGVKIPIDRNRFYLFINFCYSIRDYNIYFKIF